MKDLPWFAVYVRPRHEKNVLAILGSKGYEAFLPLYTRRAKYGKKFDLPLFPGYLFCRFDSRATYPILTTAGVLSILGQGGRPQAVPVEDIRSVRTVVQSGLTPVSWPYVSPGEQICLDCGPLRGARGIVLDIRDKKWLVISIEILQRSVAVKLELDSLPWKGLSSPMPIPLCRPAQSDSGKQIFCRHSNPA